jgi:DNA-binding NtrC family response regulator
VIIAPQGVQTFWLDEEGTLTIGRAPENEIVLDDPAMSRAHVRVYLGDEIAVEDLGSANGTRVRGARIESGARVAISIGDSFEVGGTVVVLQRVSRPPKKELRAHSYFEARLEEECSSKARGGRAPFAVINLEIEGEAPAHAIEAAVVADLKGNDVIASYAPDHLEILLLETIRPAAQKIADAIVERLAKVGAPARVGIAFHPEHGITAQALIGAASAALAGGREGPGGVVIADPAMRELYRIVDRVAQGTISVLLLGETGVGKEVVAQAIHDRSQRKEQLFLRLNCAALSETLVESELFGYEKGAFTGADKAKQGLLEVAAGGTLFLDEAGELPLGTQAKLLRVIEQREVLRVGALKARPIDVRLVAATNRDLEAEVAAGRFRRDLFYRLNGATLSIPPLRDRKNEIEPLAAVFLERAAHELGLSRPPRLSPATLEMMRAYAWPGNIRELRNVIERAVLLCEGDTVEPKHLPFEKISTSWPDRSVKLELTDTERAQKERILAALEQCAGNQTRAAEMLGVARQTLTKWLNRYDLPRPRKQT